MAEWNPGADEPNPGIGSDKHADVVPRWGTLAGFSVEAGGDEGIAIQSLEAGTTLIVQTRNSEYHVAVLDGTNLDVMVMGGQLFQDATRVRLEGATAGGSPLRLGWIGVGQRLEMSLAGRRVVTSPVRSITIEGM